MYRLPWWVILLSAAMWVAIIGAIYLALG